MLLVPGPHFEYSINVETFAYVCMVLGLFLRKISSGSGTSKSFSRVDKVIG